MKVSKRITLVVLLFVDPDEREDFEQFERRAAVVMSRHRGKIERRISFPSAEDAAQPSELHVVTFANRQSFERYRRDPEIESLAALRAKAIRHTVVWEGVELPPFG